MNGLLDDGTHRWEMGHVHEYGITGFRLEYHCIDCSTHARKDMGWFWGHGQRHWQGAPTMPPCGPLRAERLARVAKKETWEPCACARHDCEPCASRWTGGEP